MPQPIEEGMVLGGRYLVTGHVLTSADQDMVLDGRDQVLNRDVSILVASPAHASQVAASARELATGERQGTIQVLDLGLSEGRTYLIAGGTPQADELLDMVREQQVYVEPFHTDTLGSEIFGEARTYEPHVYEDDEDYYDELDDSFTEQHAQRRRPRFLKNLSERLSQRLGSDDAARDAMSGAAGAGAVGAGAAAAGSGSRDQDGDDVHGATAPRQPEQPLPDTVSDDEWTGAHEEVALDAGDRAASRPSGAQDTRSPARPEARPRDEDATRAVPTATGAAGATAAAGSRREDASQAGARGDEDATQAVARTGGGQDATRPVPATPTATTGRDGTRGDGRRPGEDSARPAPGRPEADDVADTGEVPRPGTGIGAAAAGPNAQAPVGAAGPAPARSPKVSLWTDDEDERPTGPTGRTGKARRGAGAAAAAGGAAVAGAAATAAAGRGPGGHDAGAARTGADAHPADRDAGVAAGRGDDHDEYDDEPYQDDDRPRGARWILGGILVLLLVLGAVFAFTLLGGNRQPVADDPASSAPASSGAPESPGASESPASDLPEPVIAGATRLVPDQPNLSAETDSTLPNAIDGNPATAWQPYSFAQPAFGGYASSMALVVELEEASAVTQVDITQNNGTGGSFSVLLNDSPELSGARQIAEGSFTGPQVSVPVSGEDGAPASAQYVIINFTELPRLSNASGNLPYGLRIAEVEVQ